MNEGSLNEYIKTHPSIKDIIIDQQSPIIGTTICMGTK